MNRAVIWIGGADGFLRLLDQTELPGRVVFRDCHTVEEAREAICSLRVRGAPAIGVAAAFAMILGWREGNIVAAAERLRSSRPTAVNLSWAIDRMLRVEPDGDKLLAEAHAIFAEDLAMCRAIGAHGAPLIRAGMGILTHCNAGALATSDYGTALAALYTAHESGRRFRVYADETRPLLQGARLTAWELQQRGLDVTLICDNMAARVMQEGRVQLVIVGADRIAANGDAANKIGTYGLAVLAHAHGIPFYVAAPSSTFDLTLSDGTGIPIEERQPEEITHWGGRAIAPDGIAVYNPAFDVTPARLIAGIVTERGIMTPVSAATVQAMLECRH